MFETFEIEGPILVRPRFYKDDRGHFVETYSSALYKNNGIDVEFVQDNMSLSARQYTVRGLHFQKPPFAQAKLVRVQAGRIIDIAVDLRSSSQTYGRHVSVELSAEKGEQLYVPAGFAHGFCTLEANCEVEYKVSSGYAAQADAGILWCDPSLLLNWPMSTDEATVSLKDKELPLLSNLETMF